MNFIYNFVSTHVCKVQLAPTGDKPNTVELATEGVKPPLGDLNTCRGIIVTYISVAFCPCLLSLHVSYKTEKTRKNQTLCFYPLHIK